MDREPYIPICSWCRKPYTECRCGKNKGGKENGRMADVL